MHLLAHNPLQSILLKEFDSKPLLSNPDLHIAPPKIPLQAGEQYRFHFDMTQCIGCKCCEVACHEQNNTPAAVAWRKVGEVEGGEFPNTVRLHISMACNHCLEPSCLKGCPVDAYYKDPSTGAVLMKDEACIGCGYCTWNCPYEAPQFNFERNMVTKCDFCHNRLIDGDPPACVSACPSGALKIEAVNMEEWRKNTSAGDAPGVPESTITLSTTRFTVPKDLAVDLNRIDDYRLQPERAHYSLVFMTVMTQLSVGGFLALFLAELLLQHTHLTPLLRNFLKVGPLAMLVAASLALGTSIFHLGRPLFAYRALKMWRRSWLSREVLFFGLFAALAGTYSLLRWQSPHISSLPSEWMVALGCLVALTGIAGIYSSAQIYRVPARPSWNTIRTPIAFFASALLLGPLATLFILSSFSRITHIPLLENGGAVIAKSLVGMILVAGFFQLAAIFIVLFYQLSREEHELRGTAQLLTQRFRTLFLLRLGFLLVTVIAIPLTLLGLLGSKEGGDSVNLWIGILLGTALAGELLGRYLFFVTVVPKNRPGGYF